MKKAIKIITLLIVASFAALAFFLFQKKEKSPAPQPQSSTQTEQPENIINNSSNSPDIPDNPNTQLTPAPDPTPVPSSDPLPSKFLLQIPFYSQAPFGNWDKVHEEMCEEASLLNAGLYLQDKKLSAADYDRELLKLKDLGDKLVGTWVSTTVAQTKKWADAYFEGSLNIKIINDPTIEDIETEIAAGHPVVAPLAGREIGNPNFTPPGPVYHMLVIKGYDTQNFITNDVGTRKGESYVYKKEVIMKNLHNWNPQDIHLGAKRVLVLMK